MSNAFDSVLIAFQNDAGNKAEVHNFHFHDSADDHHEFYMTETELTFKLQLTTISLARTQMQAAHTHDKDSASISCMLLTRTTHTPACTEC
jgi:hypothetical protein